MIGEHMPWPLPEHGQYQNESEALRALIDLSSHCIPAADVEFDRVFCSLVPKPIVCGRNIDIYGGFREGDSKRAKRFFHLCQSENGKWNVEYWGYNYDNDW